MKIKNIRTVGFTLIEIMIVVAIIGLLAAMAVPNFVKSREHARMVACIGNLKQIEGAKELWALETKAPSTTIPATTDIQSFLGHGKSGKAPSCPADSAQTFKTSYDPGDLSTEPRCLIVTGTHVLP